MPERDAYEVLIWSGGDEGRLWEWRPSQWRVLEHYNYRHTFEECEISARDIVVLRQHFSISDQIPSLDLLKLSPEELTRISREARVE